MDLGLQGKVVLVTGSHRGTGEVMARCFHREGARVIAHGLEEHSANHLVDSGGASEAVWGDIRADAGADQVVAQLLDKTATIDVLVNNYGTAESGNWSTASSDDWVDLYQKNVLSATRLIQRLMPYLKASTAGRIIQLGTIGSIRPNSRMPHYYAAKGALANITVSLAKELTGTGITVNTVSPGLIRTPEIEAAFLKKGKRKGWGDSWQDVEPHLVREQFPNPMERVATREEVADLVCFIASGRAGFINGQNIRIDGGAVDIV